MFECKVNTILDINIKFTLKRMLFDYEVQFTIFTYLQRVNVWEAHIILHILLMTEHGFFQPIAVNYFLKPLTLYMLSSFYIYFMRGNIVAPIQNRKFVTVDCRCKFR